jgi:hypothetical protein
MIWLRCEGEEVAILTPEERYVPGERYWPRPKYQNRTSEPYGILNTGTGPIKHPPDITGTNTGKTPSLASYRSLPNGA